ncbi:ABC transporter ATP-binding protein [Plantactinospora sp. S1510]|uniref:ABC transporter ATP-binding protein n=2 Tax=Plantactinospora alkalitolerans TaxID=2789879 RepID=A0ABS0GSR7_9ACTN|nr:ABC transporter ATP-binding protein [Plantactinospora alkalitolerans]
MMSLAWRSGRVKIVLSTALMILGGVAWPMLAFALREGINAVTNHDPAKAVAAGVSVGLLVIAALLLQHFAYVPYAETAELAVVAMNSELIELVAGSGRLEQQERTEYADRIALLRREIAQFSDGMTGLMAALALAVSMIVTGILLVSVHPLLLLLPVAAVPALFATQRAQRQVAAARDRSATAVRQAQHLFDLATSAVPAKELRVFRLQAEVRRRHLELWVGIGRVLRSGELRSAVIEASGQVVFAVTYVAAVLFVLRETVAGGNQVGDAVLVIALGAQVNQQVSGALDLLRRLQRVAESMARLRGLRASATGRTAPTADVELPDGIRHGLTMRDVSFGYPGADKLALTDVNLTLPAGSVVAIIGENGAGKTTLVKLLCRLYDATAGTIEVDGTDIRRFPVDQWRRRVTAAFQDFVRFEVPAQQTVGVGQLAQIDDRAAVLSALDRAHAGDLVDRLPQGLSTQLGNSWCQGTELSGGQWQKLALGRAMMRESPLLLILDEPTSALDAEAEHQLFERYAANAHRIGRATGAITVLVSHRFSTVRMADLILAVADGRIVEAGSHSSLLAANGMYAGLYNMQAAAYRR